MAAKCRIRYWLEGLQETLRNVQSNWFPSTESRRKKQQTAPDGLAAVNPAQFWPLAMSLQQAFDFSCFVSSFFPNSLPLPSSLPVALGRTCVLHKAIIAET